MLSSSILCRSSLLKITPCSAVDCVRTWLRLPRERRTRGIYKTNGEEVLKGNEVVIQAAMHYYPGQYVRCAKEGYDYVLRAETDGKVVISREQCNIDFDIPLMEKTLGYKRDLPIHKIFFNIVPHPQPNKFNLVNAS